MRRWMMAGALMLAACAVPEHDVAGLPEVRAQPVAAFAAGAAGAATGEAGMPVRAVVSDSGGARLVEGAACTAVSTGFRAEFAAPAVVVVPTHGRASPPVRVDCAAAGLRGASAARPMVRRTDGFYGWPAIGMGVGSDGGYATFGGWWSRGDSPDGLAVSYPAVEVVLR